MDCCEPELPKRQHLWFHPTVVALREETNLDWIMTNIDGIDKKRYLFRNVWSNPPTGRLTEFDKIINEGRHPSVRSQITLDWVTDWLLLNWPGPKQDSCE